MRMGSSRPTRYVLVPGPVIMPGLSPSTRPTRSLGVAVVGKGGAAISVRSYAEEAMLHVNARPQLGRGAIPHHAPLLEHVVVIAEPRDGPQLLVDQQHRQASLLQPLQARPDLRSHERRPSLRGLVEEETNRVRHERAADR